MGFAGNAVKDTLSTKTVSAHRINKEDQEVLSSPTAELKGMDSVRPAIKATL
jgi:hypothetical protein